MGTHLAYLENGQRVYYTDEKIQRIVLFPLSKTLTEFTRYAKMTRLRKQYYMPKCFRTIREKK